MDRPWRVTVHARVLGPAVPLGGTSLITQSWPDGSIRTARAKARGRGRPALVSVALEGTPPMRTGRHLGMVMEELTFTLDVPSAGV